MSKFPARLLSDDIGYVHVCKTFYATQLEALQVFCIKHHQYGPDNIAALGPDGVLSRMRDDKLSRITHTDSDTPGDSIADNHLDASNYMLIRLMLLRKQWPLPTPVEQSANMLTQIVAALDALETFCNTFDLVFEYDAAIEQIKERLGQ